VNIILVLKRLRDIDILLMLYGYFYSLLFIDEVHKRKRTKNFMLLNFSSPLEQFSVLPVFPITIGFLDFSITNETVIFLLILFVTMVFFYSLLKPQQNSFYLIPNR